MTTSSYRRCCCGGGGPPGGGYCEDSPLRYQIPTGYTDIDYGALESSVIPNYLTLTLPESLDLSMFRTAGCAAPLGLVSLCTVAQPYVLQTNCLAASQRLTGLVDQCPIGSYIRAEYLPASTRCLYHPRIMWEFGWSAMLEDYTPPAPPSLWPVGVTQPGRIYTRVLVRIPVKDADGEIRWLWFSNTKLGTAANWPAYTAADGSDSTEWRADRTARAEAEHSFLIGGLGLPKSLFEGLFYLYGEASGAFAPHVSAPCGCDEDSVSFDPDYEAWKGRQAVLDDNGCTEHCCNDRDVFWPADPRTLYCDGSPANVGFDDFIVQAGDQTLTPSDDDASLLYLPAAETCNAELQCADGCTVTAPSGFAPGTPLLVNCLPSRIFVELPAEISIDYRGASCGNFEATAPAPWTRKAPAESIFALDLDETLAPACGPGILASYLGLPWRGVVSPLTSTWENIGLAVGGYYYPAVSCEGETHSSRPILVFVGFALTSPTTVALADRVYRLFTMAEITPFVERLDGLQFGNAGTLYSINLGPSFRYGDYATVPVDAGDPIRTFAQLTNAWDWTQDFVFETFHFGYLPTTADVCDGYSYPPEAYEASVARTESSVDLLDDYCGDSANYPACARGDNHSYVVRVVPAFGDPTGIRQVDNLRYCSNGSPCTDAAVCGGMMMMSAPPPSSELRTLDAAEMSARRELAKAKADARQATNRAICKRCPSGEWNAVGEYCEIAYKTCRCASPALKSKAKTATWQRASVCPRKHFAEVTK